MADDDDLDLNSINDSSSSSSNVPVTRSIVGQLPVPQDEPNTFNQVVNHHSPLSLGLE